MAASYDNVVSNGGGACRTTFRTSHDTASMDGLGTPGLIAVVPRAERIRNLK
jgi:hypothetical protein